MFQLFVCLFFSVCFWSFVFLIFGLTHRHYCLVPLLSLCLSFFLLLLLRQAHLAGLRARDAEGIMSAGDERLRVISSSSEIDDVAWWWCFFSLLESCFSGFINLSLFLALPVSEPTACI